MALRPIVYSENPILREKSHRVRRVTDDVRQLVADMFETMRTFHGVGLAAVQVGTPLRIIVVEVPDDTEDPDAGVHLALINPKLVRVSKEVEEGIEGCLSVPGWVGKVERHLQVTVKGTDLQGKKVRRKTQGYLARILQHEIDHLNGVLFIDRATEIQQIETEEGTEETVEAEDAARRRIRTP